MKNQNDDKIKLPIEISSGLDISDFSLDENFSPEIPKNPLSKEVKVLETTKKIIGNPTIALNVLMLSCKIIHF